MLAAIPLFASSAHVIAPDDLEQPFESIEQHDNHEAHVDVKPAGGRCRAIQMSSISARGSGRTGILERFSGAEQLFGCLGQASCAALHSLQLCSEQAIGFGLQLHLLFSCTRGDAFALSIHETPLEVLLLSDAHLSTS